MKKIRVTIARGGVFGRLTSREISLKNDSFVVVSGPNESGKSTLAEMISWTLAGRRSGDQVDKKFLPYTNIQNSEILLMDASIEGFVDTDPFTISRQFKLRPKRGGKEPKPNDPVITLSTNSIRHEEWATTLQVASDRDFSNFYRITGPYDPDNKVGIKDLFEALAINTDTGNTPREVEKLLEESASALVAAKSSRGTDKQKFFNAHTRLLNAENQLNKIKSAKEKIEDFDKKIEDDQKRLSELNQDIEKTRRSTGEHETAKNLLATRTELEENEEELKGIEISKASDLGYENRADVQEYITNLATIEKDVATLSFNIDRIVHELDIAIDDIDSIEIDSQTIIKITDLELERSTLLRIIGESSVKESAEKSKITINTEILNRFAENLGTNLEHMMSIGEKLLDDQSFGDPIRNWNEAISRSQNDLIEVSETRDINSEENRRQRRLIGVMGASFVLTFLAMLVDRKIGIGIAAVGLIAILVTSMFPSKIRTVDSQPSQTISIPKPANTAQQNTELKIRKEKALEVLKAFGFKHELSLEKAVMLRSEKDNIRGYVQAINGAKEESLLLNNEIEKRNERLEKISELLKQISTKIGINQFNFELSVSLANNFLKLVIDRDMLSDKKQDQVEIKQKLTDLLGEWIEDTSIAQVKLKFDETTKKIERRDELRNNSNNLKRSIAASAPANSPSAELLNDVSINARVIDDKLNDLEREKESLEGQKSTLTGNIAVDSKALQELEQMSDLPEAIHKETQAKGDKRKFAAKGAAAWLAKKLVADVRDDNEAKHQPELVKRASEIADRITAGYWSAIATDDNGVRVLQNGQWIFEDALSAGARDVLRLSICLAAARAHSTARGVALPLILDDPTASLDIERSPRLFEVLKEFAEDFQIILMTHDPVIVELAVAAGATEVSLTPI